MYLHYCLNSAVGELQGEQEWQVIEAARLNCLDWISCNKIIKTRNEKLLKL